MDEGQWPNERGVLRRLTPQWLREPDLRSVVLGFEEAGTARMAGPARSMCGSDAFRFLPPGPKQACSDDPTDGG